MKYIANYINRNNLLRISRMFDIIVHVGFKDVWRQV